MRIGFTGRVVLAVVVGALALSGCPTPSGGGGGGGAGFQVDPCVTGTGIACDPVFPHQVGLPSGPSNGRLVVFFHGSGASPQAYSALRATLQAAGSTVLELRYLGATGTSSACPWSVVSTDPDCHRKFRGESVFGEGVADPSGQAYDSPAVSISGANSVANRLLRVVDWVATNSPSLGWSAFQQRDGSGVCTSYSSYGPCDLDWSKVVLMGHSLGAGIALYLAKFHHVARVGMISGPFDEFYDGGVTTVAPWITEGGFATPSGEMYGLQHVGENNVPFTAAAWSAVGMAGPAVSVDGASAPYGGAHQLSTAITPACPFDSVQKHNSTAQDLCTPGSPPVLGPAWKFLAGS